MDKHEFSSSEHLYEEITICLSNFTEAASFRDAAFQRAQSTLNLLHTLVVDSKLYEDEEESKE